MDKILDGLFIRVFWLILFIFQQKPTYIIIIKTFCTYLFFASSDIMLSEMLCHRMPVIMTSKDKKM